MAEPTPGERRRHARYPMTTTMPFYHGPSQREFPGRCSDVSAGGMLMYVPAATPVRVGQGIRLNVGSLGRPELAQLSQRQVNATIVRVERQKLLTKGHIAIGVQFAQA